MCTATQAALRRIMDSRRRIGSSAIYQDENGLLFLTLMASANTYPNWAINEDGRWFLAGVMDDRTTGDGQRLRVSYVVRVGHENAETTVHMMGLVVRFRDGRWELEDVAQNEDVHTITEKLVEHWLSAAHN